MKINVSSWGGAAIREIFSRTWQLLISLKDISLHFLKVFFSSTNLLFSHFWVAYISLYGSFIYFTLNPTIKISAAFLVSIPLYSIVTFFLLQTLFLIPLRLIESEFWQADRGKSTESAARFANRDLFPEAIFYAAMIAALKYITFLPMLEWPWVLAYMSAVLFAGYSWQKNTRIKMLAQALRPVSDVMILLLFQPAVASFLSLQTVQVLLGASLPLFGLFQLTIALVLGIHLLNIAHLFAYGPSPVSAVTSGIPTLAMPLQEDFDYLLVRILSFIPKQIPYYTQFLAKKLQPFGSKANIFAGAGVSFGVLLHFGIHNLIPMVPFWACLPIGLLLGKFAYDHLEALHLKMDEGLLIGSETEAAPIPVPSITPAKDAGITNKEATPSTSAPPSASPVVPSPW